MSDEVTLTKPASAVTPELQQSILQAAIAAGLVLPAPASGAPDAPTMRLEWGWRRLGHELGQILKGRDIFLRNNELGTVDTLTGEWRRFDQRNFAGWVEEFAAFTSGDKKYPLNGEQAAMLMAQFTFRSQIRKVESIYLIRLPVIRADGTQEFLKPGYDEATKSFTVESLKYDMDWPLDKAWDWYREMCGSFPWMRSEAEEADAAATKWRLEGNRSFSVHVAAMVGIYVRAMFPPGVLRPMFAYTANQPGSGKSVLVQMAIAPVFGITGSGKMPKNEDEVGKELDAAAQAFLPFLFLDDIGHSMHSPPLNKFVTAPRHAGRVLGGKEVFDVPAVTQVFCTANNVRGSRDLARRALIVELFYAGELAQREFKTAITPAYLARPEIRSGFLSAVCALVRHWAAATEKDREVFAKHVRPLPSFEEWTRMVAEIVTFAGYANPLNPPLVPMDEDEDQVKDLLIAAASRADGDCVMNRAELVDLAWDKELLEDVVGSRTEKGLDSKASKRFGLRLKQWRGRELVDSKGRRFQFAHRRQKQGATYPLKFISGEVKAASTEPAAQA